MFFFSGKLGLSLFFGLLLLWMPGEIIAQTLAEEETTASLCEGELEAAIAEVRERPELSRSRWGILVRTQDSQTTLYNLGAKQHFIPASNTKLLTTAAILSQLGPEYRLRTPIYATGNPPRLTSLRLVGRGDPSLSSEELRDLARQLKEEGIEEIAELVVQDGYFSEPTILPSWEWEDVYAYYGTAVNSLILDENAVLLTLRPQELGEPVLVEWGNPLAAQQWQVENGAVTAPEETPYGIDIEGVLGTPELRITGELARDIEADIWSLAIRDPAQYFLDSLVLALEEEGIKVGETTIVTTPLLEDLEAIATLESPSLITLIGDTNQPSNNLYAEALLRTLGAVTQQPSLEALTESLTALEVDAEGYKLKDGSGLSRHNLLSPEAVVQTLTAMAKSQYADLYRQSLPLAGVNGTLRRRFVDTPLQGQFYAKTGTVTGVSTLSGYIDPPEYEPLVFSVMVNQSAASVTTQRAAIDEIVTLLYGLKTCPQ